MKGEIRVVINENWNTVFHVQGAGGSSCLSLTQAFVKEIGEVLERRRTKDHYRSFLTNLQNLSVHTGLKNDE